MHFNLTKNTQQPTKLNLIHRTLWSGGFLMFYTLFIPASCLAQTADKGIEMARDEQGKYIYYEVADKNSVPADSLYIRAAAFLKAKKLKKINKEKTADESQQLTAEGKFVISKTAFVLNRPSGEVSYNFVFETKEGKYRYWLTDFLFIPYIRDRYSNFVPATPIGTPLEKSPGKLNASEWASYINAANKQAIAFATEFKEYLATGRKNTALSVPKKSVSTKNW